MTVFLWTIGVLVYWIVGIYVSKLFTVIMNSDAIGDDLVDDLPTLMVSAFIWPAWIAVLILMGFGIAAYKIFKHLPGLDEHKKT